MLDTLHILPLQESHLDGVLEIEREAFPDSWSRQLFVQEVAAPHALGLVALRDGAVVSGYSTCWLAADECTINRLAVSIQARRRGIAEALLRQMLQRARERGACMCHLDVRAGNSAALAFYRKAGFEQSGLRKNYYSDSAEDAVLMSRRLEETT